MKQRRLDESRKLGKWLFILLSQGPTCFAWQQQQQQQHRLHHRFLVRARISRETKQTVSGSIASPLYFTHPLNGEPEIDGDDDVEHIESLNKAASLMSKMRSGNNNGASHGLETAASNTLTAVDDDRTARLQRENKLLKEKLKDLEEENQMLHYEVAHRIVLETFEGEGKMRRFAELQQHQYDADTRSDSSPSLTWTGEDIMSESEQRLKTDPSIWCDQLDDDEYCPLEPMVSFREALRDRAIWLVGLLIMQSCSGVILARNEALLTNHPVIIYFLTMLVGAGGNAGNQASVRVIRGLALGTLNEQTQAQFLMRELKMAGALSAILSLAGFLRAAAFRTPFPETIAVTVALTMIVFSSVCLGAILPLILKKLRIDPAHSSTTIQVIMDILGVILAVFVSSLFLDSPLGSLLISKLGGG